MLISVAPLPWETLVPTPQSRALTKHLERWRCLVPRGHTQEAITVPFLPIFLLLVPFNCYLFYANLPNSLLLSTKCSSFEDPACLQVKRPPWHTITDCLFDKELTQLFHLYCNHVHLVRLRGQEPGLFCSLMYSQQAPHIITSLKIPVEIMTE